ATGVCGTDLALYSGGYPVPLPLTLGHEFYGEVVELGAAATEADRAAFPAGSLATAEINNTCLALRRDAPCAMCRGALGRGALGRGALGRRAMPEHCLERTVTGIIQSDGAFAEEVVVPIGA